MTRKTQVKVTALIIKLRSEGKTDAEIVAVIAATIYIKQAGDIPNVDDRFTRAQRAFNKMKPPSPFKPIPYAMVDWPKSGAPVAVCPKCQKRIPLKEMKDFESFSKMEYAAHYEAEHSS